jgi:hypothetical protein
MTQHPTNGDTSPSRVDLRDTFAAAALTGLLSRSIAPEQAMSQYVRIAAAYADAMLRERERTNHDAVPEAKAFPALWPEDEIAIEAAWERTGLKPTWPAGEAGCGVKYANAMAQEIERLRQFDRLQPIEPADATPATHATPCEGSLQGEGTLPNSYRENDEKRGVSDTKRGPVACSPTLTDEERAAIIWCVELLDELESSKGDALRSLLERLK